MLDVCASQTETMVEGFQQCKSKFVCRPTLQLPPELHANPVQLEARVSSAPPPRTNVPHIPQSNGAVAPEGNGRGQTMDPSGFFMTDTNPTPVEDLLHGALGRATTMPTRNKRKLVDEEMSGVPGGGEPFDGHARKKKRATGSMSRQASRENLENDHATKKEQPDNEHSVDDSFIRAFQERLAAKEQHRRKKAEKKRKRESGGSDGRATQNNEDQNGIQSEKPRRKKVKTSANANTATSDTTSSAPFTPTTQSRQHTPQQDRGKKRPSPATEYIGSLLANAEKKRTKRRRT